MASARSDDSFETADGEAPHQPLPQDGSSNLEDIGVWTNRTLTQATTPVTKRKGTALAAEVKAAEDNAIQEIGTTNWVGKLTQYRDAHPVPDGGIQLVETGNDDAYHPRFTSSYMINEAPNQSFGNNVSFTTKKAAKQYAAKKAIDWLIQHKRMPSDGSIKFPKPKQLSPQGTPQRNGTSTSQSPSSEGNGSPEISFASQVPQLCHRLGINVPCYKITQASPGSPICDIYADFNDDPLMQGKIGEIRNVFGKKKAKEDCARHVILCLKDIELQRLAQFEDEGQNRMRPISR